MKRFLLLIVTCSMAISSWAQSNPNGPSGEHCVVFTGTGIPHPRVGQVVSPIAMYNTVTDVLTITLDATYYGEYTITIESTLTTVDYYPISATTVIPLTGADNNISIYIDSDDCGCWYGELDKAEFGGPLGN